MPPSDADLRNALLKWFGDRPNGPSIAASLTFRPPEEGQSVSKELASKAIRHYLRRLDLVAFGMGAKRRGRRVRAIPVMEGGSRPDDTHIHYHLQLDVPDGWTLDDWKQTAASEWQKVRWASAKQNCFRDVADEGWLEYILKLRDKPSFIDAVDFENLRIN